MPAATPKTKIAILGGGVGSLAAAFELTSQPGWQDRYEITVYQMGWRLGGKCASGRNPDHYNRIEEHGLHVWMGCYQNAFPMMRKCYEELGRPHDAPLATWHDALKKHSIVTVMEGVNGGVKPWHVDFPTNADDPSKEEDGFDLWHMVQRLLRWMVEMHEYFTLPILKEALGPDGCIFWPFRFVRRVFTPGPRPRDAPLGLGWPQHHGAFEVLRHARNLAESLGDQVHEHLPARHDTIQGQLDEYRNRLEQAFAEEIDTHDYLRRLLILLELGATMARGILAENALHTGLDPLDRFEFREWLQQHGASNRAVWSAPVHALYDLVFAYEQGDLNRPNLAAGVALRTSLRMFWTYKGAFVWKMQAGMGDVVLTPFYEVLKDRGVVFKFFHRVEKLSISANHKLVETIDLGIQATLKPELPEYNPLVTIKKLPCWPSTPDYGQLVEGDALKQFDLESAWTEAPVRRQTLKRGEDFHVVVLGIPVAALKHLCPALCAADRRWQDMVERVQTVQTQAFQLWMNRDAAHLGWDQSERALLGAYPLSWSDMTQVLCRESWPAEANAKHISYFCNALTDADPIPPPFTDKDFPAREARRVKELSLQFLQTGGLKPLLPASTKPNSLELNWDYLVDLTGAQGDKRFDSQFWRANIDPNERYVLSVKGATESRLTAGKSGFDNLFLTGDWVRTGLNAGCVEAAVMAGRQASRAICGHPRHVPGETDFGCKPTVPAPLPLPLPTGRPSYVERGGEQVYSQPVALEGIRFSGFLLQARLDALEALCDRSLNAGGNGHVRYRPLLDRIMLGVADIEKLRSTVPPDSGYGWIRETDISFWVLVARLRRVGPVWVAEDIGWYQPYLFVDHPWAVAAGREIYGFAKQAASCQVNKDPADPVVFTVDASAIERFDPANEAKPERLLDVSRVGGGNLGAPVAVRNDLAEGFRDFLSMFIGNGGSVVLPGLELPVHIFDYLVHHEVPLLFLKQFRHVLDGRQTCYQSVVKAKARVTEFKGAGPLEGEYQVRVNRYDSHPIPDDLGLDSVQDALAAWHVEFSCIMEEGVEVL